MELSEPFDYAGLWLHALKSFAARWHTDHLATTCVWLLEETKKGDSCAPNIGGSSPLLLCFFKDYIDNS